MGAEGSVSVPGGSPPASPGADGGDRGGMDVVASVNRRRKEVLPGIHQRHAVRVRVVPATPCRRRSWDGGTETFGDMDPGDEFGGTGPGIGVARRYGGIGTWTDGTDSRGPSPAGSWPASMAHYARRGLKTARFQLREWGVFLIRSMVAGCTLNVRAMEEIDSPPSMRSKAILATLWRMSKKTVYRY